MNVKPATTNPQATQEINGMISMIQTLVDKGYAYPAADGTVYFRVEKFKEYGKLSHKNLDDLQSGFRSLQVSGEDQKEDPLAVSYTHLGIDTMTVYVHQDEFEEKEQQVIAGIHRAVQPDFVEMESDLALIAVVGRGMKSTRGTAGRIFSALAHANVNVKMIDQGSSELNIICLLYTSRCV